MPSCASVTAGPQTVEENSRFFAGLKVGIKRHDDDDPQHLCARSMPLFEAIFGANVRRRHAPDRTRRHVLQRTLRSPGGSAAGRTRQRWLRVCTPGMHAANDRRHSADLGLDPRFLVDAIESGPMHDARGPIVEIAAAGNPDQQERHYAVDRQMADEFDLIEDA